MYRRVLVLTYLVMILGLRGMASDDLSLGTAVESLGNGRWKWTAFIKGPSSALDRRVCVQYTLETFANSSRSICDKGSDSQPFAIADTAFGDFTVRATAVFSDKTKQNLTLQLVLANQTQSDQAGAGKLIGKRIDYGVKMNSGGSQWIFVHFTVFSDGRIEAPLTYENDTLSGFCGGVHLELHDGPNNLLETFESPRISALTGSPPLAPFGATYLGPQKQAPLMRGDSRISISRHFSLNCAACSVAPNRLSKTCCWKPA
jgi:hypothetical protein